MASTHSVSVSINAKLLERAKQAEAERVAERENGRTWHREAVALKAELAALKARCCDNCANDVGCMSIVEMVGEGAIYITLCSQWQAQP